MEKRFISLKNGLTIYTLQKESKNLPPLVLLHGWPSNCYLWRNIHPGLSDHFSIYAPDLPGHGQSDKPLDTEYSMAYYRNFLLEFFDATGIEKANLVVHDLGATAGLSLAVHNPEKIEKLVVMNTGPYSDWPFTVKCILSILKTPQLTPLFLNRFGFKSLLKTGVNNSHYLTKTIVDLYRNPWIESREGKRAFSKTIEAPPPLMAEPDEKIKNISVNTLILWGKKDNFFPYSLAEKLHEDIKGSKLVGVDNAGHFLQEDNPELVRTQILNFLRGNMA